MKVHARWLVVLIVLALLAPVWTAPHCEANPPAPRIKPGRVWVRFRDGDQGTLRRRVSTLGEGQLETLVAELDGAVLRVAAGQEAAVARRLAARPEVVYALPIPQARALAVPNDPRLPSQWALSTIGAPLAWSVITSSSQQIVAVVDTGVDLGHPDLASRIWTNPGEIAGNSIDDDGNGLADDVSGWSFVSDTGAVSDDHGHGTHVAGIAAAATDNAVGVAGVSWGASIMPVKVLDSSGSGGYDDVAQGVLYAAHNGARVVNLSVGGPDPFPPLQEALAYAREHGVLVVAAAGNHRDGTDDPPFVFYPAAYPEAMAVAATDSSDRRAAFSNYGVEVSVAAPGAGILSTCRGGGYCEMSGTSMASPHVAGLAALVWSQHPEYTPSQVAATIQLTAVDVNTATHPGRDIYLGYGRIDAGRAVRQEWRQVHLPLLQAGS